MYIASYGALFILGAYFGEQKGYKNATKNFAINRQVIEENDIKKSLLQKEVHKVLGRYTDGYDDNESYDHEELNNIMLNWRREND